MVVLTLINVRKVGNYLASRLYKELELATGLTPPSPSIKRPPRILTIIIAVVAVIGLVGPLLVSYYTDWLWFGEVQFRSVFTTVLVTRLVLFFVFALVTAAMCG